MKKKQKERHLYEFGKQYVQYVIFAWNILLMLESSWGRTKMCLDEKHLLYKWTKDKN